MRYLVFFITILFIDVLSIDASWLIKEEWISPDIENFDVHSSSLVETAKGKYCAVWKGGAGKGTSNITMTENVGVWLSLFDGTKWSTSKEIVSVPKSITWNPVLTKNPSGELLLFYRIGPEPRNTISFLKRSRDGGASWSEAEILSAGIVGPTKNKPIFTSKGTLISPSSVEVGAPGDLFKATACWIEISEDQGQHWKKIGPLELPGRKFGVIEPALFYDKQGKLRMLCRDRANRVPSKVQGFIWMAISEDEGLHWSKLKATSLPNPDSGFDVVDLGNGKLLLIYNHSHTQRYPLNLAVSLDGGDTWSAPLILSEKGEFPAGIASSDGLVHITYAAKFGNNEQRRIKHVVIDPRKLE